MNRLRFRLLGFLVSLSINQHQHAAPAPTSPHPQKRQGCVAAQPKYQDGGSARPTNSINEDENGSILGGFHNILKLPVNRHRLFEFCGHIRHGFEEAQEQAALHRVIHHSPANDPVASNAARALNLAATIPTRCARIYQRATRIARLHRHADLEITRVIRRAG